MRSDNKKIAKNTVILYIRMLFVMFVGLFTSRIILGRLGVVDFGIYNVIGGLVVILGFVNQALTNATQRYITFNIAQNKIDTSNKIFNITLLLHLFIAVAVLLIGESFGQFFLQTMMVIPNEKITAASIVLFFSLVTSFISILLVPFNAEIIAHEDMKFYAFVSVLETIIKLICVLSLYLFETELIILFSIFILLNQIIVALIVVLFCRKKYEEVFFKLYRDLSFCKEIFSFSFWSLIGNLAWVLTTHGTNVLLNLFFNPAVNAARGISVQVQSAVMNLANNFNTAINPQITINYSVDNLQRVHQLLLFSSRISFYLILIPSIPIFFESNFILELWLGLVPAHTANFVKLSFSLILIESIGSQFNTSIFATGNVKFYQLIVGGFNLVNLPISFCIFKYFRAEPELAYVVTITTTFICQIFRLLFIRHYIKLNLFSFVKSVYIPCFFVLSVCFVGLLYIQRIINIVNSVVNIIVCIISTAFCVFVLGLNKQEKNFIIRLIKRKILRIT